MILADISHPAGLIASGLLNDPLDHCHNVTMVIAILHFNKNERARALKILKELKLDKHKNIILIDGEEKPSASNVKSVN